MLRDLHGQKLCTHCWDGQHYTYKTSRNTGKKTGTTISNCLQGGCECFCRLMLEEKQRRTKIANLPGRKI